MSTVEERGNHRWAINIIRTGYSSEEAALDILADVEAWFRQSLPHYRSSWSVKSKAQSIRSYLKATSVLIEEFFADCKDQGIEIPRSGIVAKSRIERIIDGR